MSWSDIKETWVRQFRLLIGFEQYPDRPDEVPRGCIKPRIVDEPSLRIPEDHIPPPIKSMDDDWFMESRAGCTVWSPIVTVDVEDDGPVAGVVIDTRPPTICDYDGCEEEATLYDMMDNKVCEGCMEREVSDGASTYEEFRTI